jgi:hypothetical protein
MSAQSDPSKPTCGPIKTGFQTIVIAFAVVCKHFRNILMNEVLPHKNAHYLNEFYL